MESFEGFFDFYQKRERLLHRKSTSGYANGLGDEIEAHKRSNPKFWELCEKQDLESAKDRSELEAFRAVRWNQGNIEQAFEDFSYRCCRTLKMWIDISAPLPPEEKHALSSALLGLARKMEWPTHTCPATGIEIIGLEETGAYSSFV